MTVDELALVRKTKRSWQDVYITLTCPFRVLPNAMVIGAPKSGTSSLFQYIGEHPSVLLSRPKEVYFFDKDFRMGLLWYRRYFRTFYRKYRVQKEQNQQPLIVEGSTTYFEHPLVPQRIQATLPHTRFILLLRNPVDRAYSRYRHQVDRNREPLTFEDAMKAEPERLAGEVERMEKDASYYSWRFCTFTYLSGGIYADILKRWYHYFPREQILVLSSEAFFQDTAAVLDRVKDFLGLSAWSPNIDRVYNITKNKQPLTPSTRAHLVDYFRPHNERLYDLLGERFDWDQ